MHTHTARRTRIALARTAMMSIGGAGLVLAACSPGGGTSKAGATPTTPTTMAPMTSAATAPATAAGQAKVSIANFAFDPGTLTVTAGTTVVWTNKDVVAHTVTFTGAADSPVLNRGDRFTRTFTTPGTYTYFCSIHPFMHGTVVVTAK